MKKINLTLLTFLAFPLVACGTSGHHFDKWSSDADSHWKACSDEGCDEISDIGTHEFGDWIIEKEATYDADGSKHRECTVCGYSDVRTIKKLVHNFSSLWVTNEVEHWHVCTDPGYETLVSDKGTHEESPTQVLDPTEEAPGRTAGVKCPVCGFVFDEGDEIPMLTTEAYDLEVSLLGHTETAIWTLKDTSTSLGAYKLTVKKEVPTVEIDGVAYSSKTFNKAFSDIEMKTSGKDVTLTVVKPGGTTIGNIKLAWGSNSENQNKGGSLTIEGEPLTVIADPRVDGIHLNSCYAGTITIKNQLTVKGKDGPVDGATTSGVCGRYVTINEGASLKVYDFAYGIYNTYTTTINGNLEILATASADASNYDYGKVVISNKLMTFADGIEINNGDLAIYPKGVCARQLKIVPVSDVKTDHGNYTYDIDVYPTASTPGHVRATCGGGHINEEFVLPALDEINYTISAETLEIDGAVYNAKVYTYNSTVFKGIIIPTEKEEITEFFKLGTQIYSVDTWNTLYPTQHTSVDKSTNTLTVTLNEDLVLDKHDGTLDLTLFDKVVINGNHKLSIKPQIALDGILANTFEIAEGTTVELVGYDKTLKSGIKCLVSLDVKGTLLIENFGYAHAVADGNSSVTIAETGTYKVKNCGNGIYTWDDVTLHVYGTLDIRDVSGCGIGTTSNANKWNHIYFHGDSKISIITGNTAICRFQDLIIGDGDNGATKNNAEVYLESLNKATIIATRSSSCEITILFNSSKETYIKGGAGCMTLDQGKHHLFFLTNVAFESTGNQAIWCSNYSGNTYPEIVYDNLNPTIRIVDCSKFVDGANKGSLNTAITIFRDAE